MLRYLGILAAVTFLVGGSLGYAFATATLHLNKSIVFEGDEQNMVINYQFTITLESISGALPAKERKAIVAKVCDEAKKDFTAMGW